MVDGTEKNIKSVQVKNVSFVADAPLRVRATISSATKAKIKVTVWRAGTKEPKAQLSTSDSTKALRKSGTVGVWGYQGADAPGGGRARRPARHLELTRPVHRLRRPVFAGVLAGAVVLVAGCSDPAPTGVPTSAATSAAQPARPPPPRRPPAPPRRPRAARPPAARRRRSLPSPEGSVVPSRPV